MIAGLFAALKSSVRVARRADVGVLIAAIAVAVAASTTVGLFTSRLQGAIRVESATVLAADLRLESGRSQASLEAPEVRARAAGLKTARTISMTSVIHVGDRGQLATILAADEGYPLRGQLHIAQLPYGATEITTHLPEPGSAYVDARLASRLGIEVGGVFRLGATTIRVAAILADRPDRGSGMSEVAPTALVRHEDLFSSGLLGPGSRATYTLLVAGEPSALDPYAVWIKNHKSAAERLVSVADSSAQLGTAAERSGHFLHLAAMTTVLLSAIALAMACRRYAVRRRDEVALLKCLGATKRRVFLRFAHELLVAALLGGLLGIAVGYLAQIGLADIARVFTGLSALPAPGWTPSLLGLLTAMVMMAGFGLPPIVELARVPPTRVLREGASPRPLPVLVPAITAVGALLLILFIDVRDVRLMLGAGLSLAIATAVYAAVGFGLTRLLARVDANAGVAWRFAVSSLARRSRETIAQLVSFGLGMTILLVLSVVRIDLLNEWQRAIPSQAPNHFFINIAPTEREAVHHYFETKGISIEFAPWVRARLLSVNGVPMQARMPTTDRGRAFAEREQNLSISATLPADNEIVEGRWGPSAGGTEPTVSVATEFRDELKLQIGDRLSFDVAGDVVDATVGSIRRVRWDSFRPNFFLLFSPGVLEDNIGSYLAAAHLDSSSARVLAEFDRQFPTVTVLDVGGLLGAVRQLLDRATMAVTYVFLFTLFAGFVVLAAGVQATADERRFETALLKTFGATRQRIMVGVVAEFAVLGALCGILSATMAAGIGYWMATQWLHLPWTPHLGLWLWGCAYGVLAIGCAGVISTWRVAATAPIRILRGT